MEQTDIRRAQYLLCLSCSRGLFQTPHCLSILFAICVAYHLQFLCEYFPYFFFLQIIAMLMIRICNLSEIFVQRAERIYNTYEISYETISGENPDKYYYVYTSVRHKVVLFDFFARLSEI